MAQYVVPPRTVIVKCESCKTLYVPDRSKDRRWNGGGFANFEKCPVCGSDHNEYKNTIPLWKYNLIRFFRRTIKYER